MDFDVFRHAAVVAIDHGVDAFFRVVPLTGVCICIDDFAECAGVAPEAVFDTGAHSCELAGSNGVLGAGLGHHGEHPEVGLALCGAERNLVGVEVAVEHIGVSGRSQVELIAV